jgi:dCTP deaminase
MQYNIKMKKITETTIGVLPSQNIRELIKQDVIFVNKQKKLFVDSKILEEQIQPTTLDLRIGQKIYYIRGSFLPEKKGINYYLQKLKIKEEDMEYEQGHILFPENVYLVELLEEFNLPKYIYGKTNPKSSIGRLDVFTRVISEHATQFDKIPAGYKGKLYIEISPRSFPIKIYPGTRLSQIRLQIGNSIVNDDELKNRLNEILPNKSITDSSDYIQDGLHLRVSLKNITNINKSHITAFTPREYTPVIDLKKVGEYKYTTFWQTINAPNDKDRGFFLSPEKFYLLATKERVTIPKNLSAELVDWDSSFGEFRSHYAGFFDSGFGLNIKSPKNSSGARAVVELRSHDIQYFLEDEKKMYRMLFYKNIDIPDKLYGEESLSSHYQGQELKLSKYFTTYFSQEIECEKIKKKQTLLI